jgi:very-short-patch-repair endonuclease
MGAKVDTRHIAVLAARQHGLVTRSQLLTSGVTRNVAARLVADGWLHRVHRGVYAVGHTALSRRGRWLAATLALGPDAVLSHRSAGELWAILPPDQPVEISATGRTHRDGITVYRARLSPRERTAHNGIPTTPLPRTLLDLAAVLDARALARAFEEAQVRHRLRPAELRVPSGARGVATLRALVEEAVDPAQVESVLELRFLKLCAAYGLPRPLTQVRMGPWRADFWFARERVVVETDGARFHATTAKRARDAQKRADLEARGEAVVRVTWADVDERPGAVADLVRAALSRDRVRPR